MTGWYTLLAQTLLGMIGFPDYPAYVAHRRQHHPEQPILSEAEFMRVRQEARYGGGKGHSVRCC
ncbi:MAG: YbdD/YjiX family protein [Magnetococcales bacterium]|nr:YbdD/YjiX family protein [Magnetococcales bacterium]